MEEPDDVSPYCFILNNKLCSTCVPLFSLPSGYLTECSMCRKKTERIKTVVCHDAKQVSDVSMKFHTEEQGMISQYCCNAQF